MITLLVIFAANLFITNVLLAPAQPTTITLPYNIFKEQVTQDNVVTVTTTGDAITGVTKTAVAEPGTGTKATHFTTQHPSFANDNLETLLEQHGVVINAKPANPPLPHRKLFPAAHHCLPCQRERVRSTVPTNLPVSARSGLG